MSKRQNWPLWILLTFCHITQVHAQANALGGVLKLTKEIPKTLYHWTNKEKLSQLALGSKQQNPLATLRPCRGLSKLESVFPPLTARGQLLFTWNHPVTGLMSNPHQEVYAHGASGPTLLTLNLRPQALKTLHLRSLINFNIYDHFIRMPITCPLTMPEAQTVDLIYHEIYNGFSTDICFREWVIVNPQIVSSASAQCPLTKKQIAAELDLMKNNKNFTYNKDISHCPGTGIFSNSAEIQKHVVPWLELYLKEYARDIPDEFR